MRAMNELFVRWTSLWIGWRYLRGQRRQFVSFISWVSVIGLGLGVAVLVVVISVMNGFDRELRTRILGTVPHIVLYPPRDVTDVSPDALAHARLSAVGQAFPFFEAEGMVTRDGAVHGVALYGIDAAGIDAMPVLAHNMRRGALEDLGDAPGGLVMGALLARHLGLSLGDDVALVLSTPLERTVRPRFERFTLTGTFEVGADPDYGLVLIDLAEVERRGLADTGRRGIRLVLPDALDVAAARETLQPRLPAGWQIVDWREAYGGLFRAVELEKAMMFLLMLLIVAVAAFNIISAQAMLVHEKRADIAILRTMGASTGLIFRMVLMQGMVVAVAGVGLGIALGLLLAAFVTETVAVLEFVIGARLLEGSYFDAVPSQILVSDIVLIIGMALVLCVLSSLYPARRAAELNPADALHGM
jgi:lipoprotein-releasing system permease protein